MPTEHERTTDAEVVGAIRAGDRERYRELVERYADKVFAIAWARLGDRGLAEEATQEAFIKGYRRLGLLAKAERFGAWIATIARHTSINLGMRHRGELQRRRRWALEPELGPNSDGEAGTDEDGPLPNPETLRATLEELPPGHRECLVLFYLENRSGAEASTALGITENAFKARLHRARAALRSALEGRLESGLQRLRAPARISSAVMLAVSELSRPGAYLGLGAAVSALGKALPFGYVLAALQVVAMLPGLAVNWWIGRKELANFREPDGFRGHYYRLFMRRMLFFVGGMVLLAMVLSKGLSLIVIDWAERLGIPLAEADVGIRPYALLFGGLMLVSCIDQWRRLHCIRHPLNIATSLALPIYLVIFGEWIVRGSAAGGSFWVGQALFMVIMSFGIPKAPPRMDQSLFTRAAHGLLGSEESPEPEGESARRSRATPANRLALARFLGHRQMIEDWRRVEDGKGLELRLARVATSPILAGIPFLWRGASRLRLEADGRVTARLAPEEARDLEGSMGGGRQLPEAAVLEERVTRAVGRAWSAVATGEEAAAARWLGEETEAAIFRVTPERSRAMRIRVWMMRMAAVLMLGFGIRELWFKPPPELSRLSYMKPVAIEATHVRGFLARLAPGHAHYDDAWEQLEYGLHRHEGLPPRELLEPDVLRSVQRRLASEMLGAGRSYDMTPEQRVGWMMSGPSFQRAVLGGWFTVRELEELDLGPSLLRAGWEAAAPAERERWSGLPELTVRGGGAGPDSRALMTRELAMRVRFLNALGAGDLLDLAPVVGVLVDCQILEGKARPGRWTPPDPKEWNGLFSTRWGETLGDTHDVLTILEAAKALDRIDREACVAGLLRFHRGGGLFVPHGVHPGVLVSGNSTETWVGYASLKILGALDRVKDLAKWEFRPTFPGLETRTRRGTLILPWEQVEAWSLREAFRRER